MSQLIALLANPERPVTGRVAETTRCTQERGRGIEFPRRSSGGSGGGGGCQHLHVVVGHARYSARILWVRICIIGDQHAVQVTSKRDDAVWLAKLSRTAHWTVDS